MLQQFREDRDKRKMAPPPSATVSSAGGVPSSPGVPRGGDRGDYRSQKDEYRERDRDRERDRGYDRERYSSRYE